MTRAEYIKKHCSKEMYAPRGLGIIEIPDTDKVRDLDALIAAAKAEERARIEGLIDSHGFVEGCCEDRHGDPACHITVMQQLARGEEGKGDE